MANQWDAFIWYWKDHVAGQRGFAFQDKEKSVNEKWSVPPDVILIWHESSGGLDQFKPD